MLQGPGSFQGFLEIRVAIPRHKHRCFTVEKSQGWSQAQMPAAACHTPMFEVHISRLSDLMCNWGNMQVDLPFGIHR